jgi:hypothetical protein
MPSYAARMMAAALMLAAAGTVSAQTMAPNTMAPNTMAPNTMAQNTMPQNNPAAEANVKQSEHYSQTVHSNKSFRAKRMQEECGPITDPQLHAQCIASFNGDDAPQH